MLLAHKAFEEQMALEHQRALGVMRAENERILAEASQLREHFARTMASVPEISLEDVKRSQSILYDEFREERLILKAESMKQKYEAELKARRRKEEDLVSAEERISQLESALKRLEDLAEREPKRPHPSRSKGDSPEQHAEKKSRPTDGYPAQTSEASDFSSPAAPQPVTPAESKIQKVLTVRETKAAEPKTQKVSTVPERKAAEPKFEKVSTVPETKAAESKTQKASTVPEKKAAELEIQKVSTAQGMKAAEPEIQKSPRAHVEEVEEIVSSGESSGSSSDDHGEESSASSSKDSVASIPTWAPDPFDTTSHYYHSSTSGKDSHYRMSVQVPPSQVQKRTDGLYTDEEKGRLTLEAWRARLRNTCQYTPDRDYSDQHHIAKIRVLQTALTNLKKNTWNLSRLEQLEYRHEHYRILGQQYGIPADLRSVDEVYGKIAEGSQLERYRCVPISHYYRMLMEDTPGFTRTQSPDRSRESNSRSHDRSRESNSRPHDRSRESSSRESSSRPHNSSRSRSGDTSTASSNRRTARSIDETKRANDRIADLKRKLLLVEQRKAPREYEFQRSKELNQAERERKQGRSAPGYLEGIELLSMPTLVNKLALEC
jgi:hypothetical protein